MESAIDPHQIDIPWLATSYNAIGADETFKNAVDATIAQGIKVGDTTIQFTTSSERVRGELARHIFSYNQRFMLPPSAADSDSDSSQ